MKEFVKFNDCVGKTIKLIHPFYDGLLIIFTDDTWAGLEAHKEWESYEIIDHEPTTHTWPYVEIGIQSKEEYELAVEKAKQDAIKRNEARDKNLYLELKAKFENVS